MTVLAEEDCLRYLGSHDVGRIAFAASNGRVEAFPINYAMEGRVIVFRTAPGTKLDVVPRTEVVFEIDDWDPRTGVGWSVVARGRAEEVTTNPGRAAEHLRWVPVHPVAPGAKLHWIGIAPSEITGRFFQVPPPKGERP